MLTISDWWDSLSAAHQVFWFIAIVFSVLFLIQFVLLLIGLDSDSADGLDHDPNGSLEHGFNALSLRSIIAFFTFFGWTGVLTLQNNLSVGIAVVMASISGLTAMFIVAYLIYKFSQLEQSGTLDIYQSLGQSGEVYLPIPGNQSGQGKIHVHINGVVREMDAVTDGELINTGARVKVLEVLEHNVLRVAPETLISNTHQTGFIN